MGNYEKAQLSSMKARFYVTLSIIIGIILNIVFGVLVGVFAGIRAIGINS